MTMDLMTADNPAPQPWPELGGELNAAFQQIHLLNYSLDRPKH